MNYCEIIKTKENAIYINFPFCEKTCSYCHYIKNLSFGHKIIPEDYFKLVLKDMENLLENTNIKNFESIYFGGGTPSLLTDKQCFEIESLLKKYNIEAKEISIEIHPGLCNFDYVENSFFTRYSIGVQSFNTQIRKKYNRENYSNEDIFSMIKNIRKCKYKKNINIDLIFYDKLDPKEISYINILKPETVTFYPNTKGRGKERLISVLNVFDMISKHIKGYHTLGKSKFIYVKDDSEASHYSKIEYEYIGNIFGIGHNSITYIGDKSYLSKYKDNEIVITERKKSIGRVENTLMNAITSGARLDYVEKYFPYSIKNNFFYTVQSDTPITDKYVTLENDNLIYIPEDEYIRFYDFLMKSNRSDLAEVFLKTIGFGDSDIEILNYVYNKKLNISLESKKKIEKILGYKINEKIKFPTIRILIEGIDGSGKDTFAKFFIKELKNRFLFDDKSRISLTGQPNSKNPEAEPEWYKHRDLLGMMLYIDNFAGNLNGVRGKLDYLQEAGARSTLPDEADIRQRVICLRLESSTHTESGEMIRTRSAERISSGPSPRLPNETTYFQSG